MIEYALTWMIAGAAWERWRAAFKASGGRRVSEWTPYLEGSKAGWALPTPEGWV